MRPEPSPGSAPSETPPSDPRRRLPSIQVVLDQPALRALAARHGRAVVREAAREELDQIRADATAAIALELPELSARIQERVGRGQRLSLRPVLNATGILLHTNLGRAPLARPALRALTQVARGYTNLEIDLETGQRGGRSSGAAELLTRLTGAEAAAIVNNNAAATVLALRSVASGRQVIVSRGQLVEIGGSYRLPEIFAVSGAQLCEVGTTNKTRLSDYAQAIGAETAAILRVHTSNYRIVGFTEEVPIEPLASLAHAHGLVAIDDIGSGAIDRERPGYLDDEPTVAGSIAAGSDLVLCSGDKLLGGPQCGLLLGSRACVERAQRDPLMRALRVDKLTLAALEATLRLALDPATGGRFIPLWSFLSTSLESLRERAQRLARQCRDTTGLAARACDSVAQLGGGAAPMQPLTSAAVRLDGPWPAGWSADSLARGLRLAEPAVLSRIHDGSVWLDLKAIGPREDRLLLEALQRALKTPGRA